MQASHSGRLAKENQFTPTNHSGDLTFSFPAATTTVMPALVKAEIAELSAVDFGPAIDMLTTAFPASPRAVAFVATGINEQCILTDELEGYRS